LSGSRVNLPHPARPASAVEHILLIAACVALLLVVVLALTNLARSVLDDDCSGARPAGAPSTSQACRP
jgi:hypothetical protein